MSSKPGTSAPNRPALAPAAWIIFAYVLGASALGALDCARIGSATLALAVVPLFAATGLVIGLVVAFLERISDERPWWLRAIVLALPTLAVSTPVAATLFDGAYARTLPLAEQAPYLAPVAVWFAAAIVIAIGQRMLRSGDLATRGIVVLALAGMFGGIVWTVRHVLRAGYPGAHVGATFALIACLGLAIRVTRRHTISAAITALVIGIVAGTAASSAMYGLGSPADRQRLATYGDQSRDLVRLWRAILDFDRDGSSALLGGGDCDDFDARRHPGALDVPGDGIDQDCDSADAVAQKSAPAAPSLDFVSWRATPAVRSVIDRTRSMSVVLVTVDALRYDLLAPGAAHREDFPRIARLLDESVWFSRAIAPASGTDVSLSTLLTGRSDPYQPVTTTLIEAMRALGRRTYAAIPGEVTRYVGEVLLQRGVDKFSTVHTDWEVADVGDHVSAGATTLEGINALDDAAGRSAFIWLHYFDVHEHHQINVPASVLAAVHDGGSPVAQRYRALLRAIDSEVGRFVDELATRHLDDRTMIVFVSDHGEALGGDPRLLDTHGQVAYAPLVHVPFALHVPGVPAGERTDVVSLVDLAPTLLDLLDAPSTMSPLDGTDLLPAILDAPSALRQTNRAIAIHEELQWSVVEWPYQVLVKPAENIVELYDLSVDPDEHADLAAKSPDVVKRLRGRYAEFPEVHVDRTPTGRSFREQQAQPPPPRAPR
ncbi:MAG: sulfatase [Myxococcales bacterium]|nr:sulfatase [Myxococcales bacterium]